MENRYGSSETKIGPSGPEPPPLKPVRHIRRPEMYPSRRMQEQSGASLTQHQPQPVPRAHPRDPSTPRSSPLHKSTSTHNLTQTDTPWESITLNRCLFVAVVILLLSSGLRKLHALGGHHATHEEESGLTRRLGALKHRAISETQPQSSLWEVVFWWMPDLTDEDEESGKINRGRSKRRAADKISRSHRNRPLLENLMKPRENKLKDRRRKRTRDDSEKVDVKNKLKETNSLEETEEGDVDEVEGDGDIPVKSRGQMKKED
ncbi:uncharacterized protein LOC130387541 isoform X2 [Gadus chalcogrammus]|uniref:uncharacterized protein LOC130387541 isoform X2 n=1 Tax=Gadus chalcogrammus TaxID=1042646 RepID=UPI0024C4903C|nr:uncharacterized protein LOC130387541 isoform X2 [Gadus chalcogrammus]